MSRKVGAEAQSALFSGICNFSNFLTCTPHADQVKYSLMTLVPLPTLFFLLPTLIGKSKDPGEDFFLIIHE